MSSFLSYGTALAVIYCLYILYEIFQLCRIVYYRHKIRSFKTAFFSLLFLWGILRVIFFAYFVNDQRCTRQDYAAIEIIYWIAIPIQFSTFSLLVIYYAHLHHKHKSEWYSFKRKYMTIWIVVNLLFYILEISILGVSVAKPYEKCHEPTWAGDFHQLFAGTIFLILATVIGFYGWRVTRVLKASTTQTKLIANLSFPRIMTVSFGLFVVFTLRCAYDFATRFAKKLVIDVSGDRSLQAAIVVIFFIIFELIPTTLVLVLVGHVKSTTLGVLSKNKFLGREANFSKASYEYSRLNPSNPFLKSELFNDPKRYDSDDEGSASFSKPSPSPSPYGYGNNSSYLHTSDETRT